MPSGATFTIFSDSKSALQSLEIFNPIHPFVLKILEWVFLHSRRGIQIRFCWVPAHVGVLGNDKADLLAKTAASNLIPPRCQLPHRDFLPGLRTSIKDVWQQRWDNIGVNKMKEITDLVNPWQYIDLPRKQEIMLCRLRIGHTRITHSYLMAGEYQPHCCDCLVPLTVRHFLIECPSLVDLQNHFFQDCHDEEENFILGKVIGKNCNFSRLYDFLEEAGFLLEI